MSNILEVKDLHVSFKEEKKSLLDKQQYIDVIKGVSLTIREGQIIGLVGESGCGKSTLARTILGLNKATSGEIIHYSQRPQMIFQDPKSSLNPCKKISFILEEPLRNCTDLSPAERREKAASMLEEVGLSGEYLDRYPDQLSGGQRQRICIAQSLMLKPGLLIADEPVSALDVTIQAQVIKLLRQLHSKYKLSILFISHDLRVVYQICGRVCVLKDGKIVEQGNIKKIYSNPSHEYTKNLLISAGICKKS